MPTSCTSERGRKERQPDGNKGEEGRQEKEDGVDGLP